MGLPLGVMIVTLPIRSFAFVDRRPILGHIKSFGLSDLSDDQPMWIRWFHPHIHCSEPDTRPC